MRPAARRLSIAALAAVVLGAAGPARAGDALTDRPSLKDVRAFRVVVEDLGAKAERMAGLRREDLQAHVESRLARAGIAVSPQAPAILYVNVALACNGVICAYTVALEVQQKVRLEERPSAATMFATTWSTGATGIAGRRAEGLRDRVREQADRFVEAYRSVNPAK